MARAWPELPWWGTDVSEIYVDVAEVSSEDKQRLKDVAEHLYELLTHPEILALHPCTTRQRSATVSWRAAAQKALIAAKYSGAELTVAKDFVFGESNKKPEFLNKFPLGKVPAFEGSDGVLLTESNAIAYYVANEELRGGSDAAAKAQVVQWMCMADNEILPASCTWVFPTMGIMQYNKTATERAKEDIKAALKTLNDHLLTKTFLVGERLTLADIAVACTMLSLYKQVLDPAFRKPFTNVNRWFTTVVNQPNAKAVLGQVKLCSGASKAINDGNLAHTCPSP